MQANSYPFQVEGEILKRFFIMGKCYLCEKLLITGISSWLGNIQTRVSLETQYVS